MRTSRAAAVIASAAIVLTLAGCSYSKADALATHGSVIELTNSGWDKLSTFGYVTSDHQIIKLDNCGTTDEFFGQKFCEDSDHVYHFEWSTPKGRVSSARLTTDGVTYELSCSADNESEDAWSPLYVCLPKD